MKKFAVLADIHGNLPALEAVVADLRRRSVTHVFNLGDCVSGPLWPLETARCLMKQDWVQIGGNHERQLTRSNPAAHGASDAFAYARLGQGELDWLGSLPGSARAAEGVLLCHGAPGNDMTYLLETVAEGRVRPATPAEIAARLNGAHAPVLLCGHTHTPRLVRLPDGMLILNPGSVGLPAYEDDAPQHHVVETGSPHARYAVLEEGAGGWSAALVAVPYDHESAAARAGAGGRPDWDVALRTGFMSK